MLDTLLAHFAKTPTPTTSPVYLAVNTVAMRTRQGLADGATVNVYTTRKIKAVAPYVRLLDTGVEIPVTRSIGGAHSSVSVARLLKVECCAVADDDLLVSGRASALRLTTLTTFMGMLGSLPPDVIRTDEVNGSGAYYHISSYQPANSTSDPVTEGPGINLNQPLWVAWAHASLEVLLTTYTG